MSPAPQRPFPGVVWGDYPQRDVQRHGTGRGPRGLAWLGHVQALSGGPSVKPYERFARRVLARVQSQGPLDAFTLGTRLAAWRTAGGFGTDAARVEIFSLACAAFESSLGLRPYPSQVIAARVMLDDRLAEMATGEGKTVAIAMAAAMAALENTPVHVMTANDYLAARDAAAMAPFFAALGLRAGVVTQPLDQAQRRAAWREPVTYCTAKELVFDYLRDGLNRPAGLGDLQHRARRLAAEGQGGAPAPLLRGLSMAIVDEADTVLIDEAMVPMVLSQPGAAALEHGFLQEAARRAAALTEGEHYELLPAERSVALTEAGRAALAAWTPSRQPVHNDRRHREATVGLALTAAHLLHNDRDYVVRDGQVVLVDETTGRAAPGRAWSRGLHQLVEIKEGVAFTARNETVAQITFQRFFPRYLRLAGMSGTVGGSAYEMSTVYGLATVAVPPRLPPRSTRQPTRVYPDSAALWQAVAARAREVGAAGRPVLVGTGSVAESQALSAVLGAQGLAHAVLNARQDAGEGEVIARAGERGRITVATSMAGRGSDIALGEGVAALGGLHVILCQLNASRRIDRQFTGRAARQGLPGSFEAWVALDFPVAVRSLPRRWRAAATRLAQRRQDGLFLAFTLRFAQGVAAYTGLKQRQTLCRADEETERELTFNRETFS